MLTNKGAEGIDLPGKCHWCGDIKSGFYHIECAVKMSRSNFEGMSDTVAMYQALLKSEKEKSEQIKSLLMKYMTEEKLSK